MKPPSRAAAFLALLAGSTLGARSARAQPPPASVEVSATTCASPPVPMARFLGILTAELRADGVERVDLATAPGEPRALAAIAIHAEPCEGPPRDIVLHIEDAATRKSVERRVSLGDVAERSRPRALALAVAELLRASWLELGMPDAPPPEVPVPPAARHAIEARLAAAAPAAPSPVDRAAGPGGDRDVSVALAWRAFPAAHASLLGGEMAAAVPVARSWLVRGDAGALFGASHDVLGDVSLGVAWLGAALLYTSPPEATVSVAVGPRVDAGIAWASGNPVDQAISSRVGTGFVSSVSLLGALRYRLGPSWRAAIELQAGAVAVPFEAQADARRVTGIDGALFGLALGVSQER